MRRPTTALSMDQVFSVPFTHRLRTTENVTGNDFGVLDDLLHRNEDRSCRVLLVGETALGEATSLLERRFHETNGISLVHPKILVDGGEAIKNGEHGLRLILDRIHETGLDRRSYIVAVGGGAMLDTVGMAAAIAHRGIRLIRLPSTVLAQADSGVGVKNAVNYFQKKNWIGTFAVPWAVINDASLLETLPPRDFVSGFSEAVKVSLLKDRDEFQWLCEHAGQIARRDPEEVRHAIARSCFLHLQHITEGGDPFEMLEARPLDFGHWSAHRLEPLTHYAVRHGEAVAIGVAIDCLYSAIKFGFPHEEVQRVCQCFFEMGIPLWHPELLPIDRLLQGLEEFRQHLGGRLTITMLQDVGCPINVHQIDEVAMQDAIHQLEVISKASKLC